MSFDRIKSILTVDNLEKSAIATLAAGNGYIIFTWYVKSMADKSLWLPLDWIFGIAAFVALDLAMLTVVLAHPDKDKLGWATTIATSLVATVFSALIAYDFFSDALHAAFTSVQFVLSMHIAYNRHLKHKAEVAQEIVSQEVQEAPKLVKVEVKPHQAPVLPSPDKPTTKDSVKAKKMTKAERVNRLAGLTEVTLSEWRGLSGVGERTAYRDLQGAGFVSTDNGIWKKEGA